MILNIVRFLVQCSFVMAYMGYLSVAYASCTGPYAMLFLINRPSIAESACAVPLHSALVESGYQNFKSTNDGKHINTYPLTHVRVGLPKDSEVSVSLPNYVQHPTAGIAGFSASSLTLKKEIYENSKTIFTLDGTFGIPSGGRYYGQQAPSGTFSGIFNHTFNDYLTIAGMFGVLYQGQAAINPDKQFSSFNPDIVLSLNITPSIVLYGEVYGQTKVAYNLGSGYNADGGFIFLIKDNFTMDIEISHRLSGYLGGFESYVGAGCSLKLG